VLTLLVKLIDMVARLKTTTSVVMAWDASHGAGGVSLWSTRAVFLDR